MQSNDKTIEGFKKLLDEEIALNEKKQNLIIDQLVKMADLYGIIEKHLPQTFVKEAMNENYQFIKNYLKKAGDNLSGPLKISGITLDETLTKFEYDDFDFDFIHEANHKSVDLLKIVEISNKTTQLTPAAFELLEAKEKILKKLQKLVAKGIVVIKKKDDLLINQLDKMLNLYVIIEKVLPGKWEEYSMEINYDFIRKFLKNARGYSF